MVNMDITKAEYITIDQHPFLRLIIDGKEALIGDFKWSLLELGVVPLHSRDPDVNWETILPEIHIPATEYTDSIDFKGFTNDPVIIQMAYEFWKAINSNKFSDGPILK